MAPDPAISVIISTRNRAHYLPETLRTLAVQDCAAPFEVVVIDNASSDGTAALLLEWCRGDGRFRTASEPRPGLSRGKNAGIRLARAPLLLFTDDDMRLGPGWIDAYRRLFSEHDDPLMVAGGPIVPIAHDLGPWPRWLDAPALADAGLLDYQQERALGQFEYVWGGNMAVPRRVFDQLGSWDEAVGLGGDQRVTEEDSAFFEDTQFQDRVRSARGSVWFCPGAAARHRVLRQSVTPRRILATAFARGRNDIWRRELAVWHEMRLVPARNALRCVLGLARSLIRWGVWLVAFRLSGGKRPLERARRAAFESGRWLDSLRAGRDSMQWFLRVARFAFPVRAVLLRLTPNTP